MNYGFIIDNRKCIGCHACTVACKAEHEVPVGVNRTWVKYIEKGTFPDTRRLFSVMRCNHCADAPCVEICPVTALFTRKDGIVDFDDRRCIGCKACTQACPYDAIYMHPDDHTSAKCNYCTHRVDIGLEPACVNVCPEHAIISGDMDNPASEISQILARETVTVRKPEKGTNPRLFYIDGDKASLDPTAAHPDSDYMWSSQRSGVGHHAGNGHANDWTAGVSPAPRRTSVRAPVQIQRAADNDRRDILRELAGGTPAVQSKPRRVYDAPNKGVLWGWEVSAYVWTKAIAAGAFIVPVAAGFFTEVPPQAKLVGTIVALVFLAITGGLLTKDLGRPERFLYVLLRPQWNSWLTRGGYIITVYGGLLTAWLAANYFGWQTPLSVIEPIGVIFALLTAVYTAFLFAQAKGRDFWQSPMLGLHMLLHSLMAGVAVFMIAAPFVGTRAPLPASSLAIIATTLIIINLITIALELMTTHATNHAATVAKMITRGQFSPQFWLGTILIGHVLPLLMFIFGPDVVAVPAGVLVLIGLYFGEHIWVKAPQLVPLS